MKKKYLVGILAVQMIMTVLTGCRKQDADSTTETAILENEAVEASEASETLPDFYPSNDFEARIGKGTFQSFDEIIELLEEGEAYGYANVMGQDDEVLFIAQEAYDWGDGTFAAVEATPYTLKSDGMISADSMIISGGTANPLSTSDDGIIYCATHTSIDKYCYGENGTDNKAIMMLASISADELDENGSPKTVSGFVRTQNSLVNDDMKDIAPEDVSLYEQAFKEYESARPIPFLMK